MKMDTNKKTADGAPNTATTKRKTDPAIDSLAQYATALDTQTQSERDAGIRWLARRYLGIRI